VLKWGCYDNILLCVIDYKKSTLNQPTQIKDNVDNKIYTYSPILKSKSMYFSSFYYIYSSLPLENNSNTVLVVGGVQWLAKQHIDLIVEALQR
jgi:hypothetical protein